MFDIEFFDYCARNIADFETRFDSARTIAHNRREPLEIANPELFQEMQNALDDFCEDYEIDPGAIDLFEL